MEGAWVVPIDGYSVCEWSPDADHACGPTQVHVVIPLEEIIPGASLSLRLKSRRAVNELIAVLKNHRNAVWPLN